VQFASDPALFPDVMRIVSGIPELSISAKLKLLRIAAASDLSDPQNRRTTVRALNILTVGTEGEAIAWQLVLTLIKDALSEPDYLTVLLPIGDRLANVPQCVELFERDDLLLNIARSQDHDCSVRISAYQIVKKFKGEAAQAVLSECSLLDSIDINSCSFPGDRYHP
jgi:hypothetical protein